MSDQQDNVDAEEIARFAALADSWWDPDGPSGPLHDINPLRLNYIEQARALPGTTALDVGCGGGLVSEGLARRGARVTGIDLGVAPLEVARAHAEREGVEVEYRQVAVEELAAERPEHYDLVTCLEMLEHVPDPAAVVAACARLTRPDGDLVFSTINRNPKSFLLAIVGGEYVLNMIPRGTHEYAKLIRPSELAAWCREAGLDVVETTGMTYHPITGSYRLGRDVSVNYFLRAHKPAAGATE